MSTNRFWIQENEYSVFCLAIRIALIRNPCHPVFRKPDGSFLKRQLPCHIGKAASLFKTHFLYRLSGHRYCSQSKGYTGFRNQGL
jgi:hypothetical protein